MARTACSLGRSEDARSPRSRGGALVPDGGPPLRGLPDILGARRLPLRLDRAALARAPRAQHRKGDLLASFNRKATRLYTVNTATASVSVYDTTKPTRPIEVQALTLRDAMTGPPFVDGMGMTQTYTSQPFQEALAPDEKNLYVVSQRATTNASDPNGNILHTIDVATDGSISEPAPSFDLATLGVPASARPHGVLVY